MLSIRDRAFAGLGDRDLADLRVRGRAPAYTIDQVTDYTVAQQPNVARRVEGHVTVPCYLDQPGCPPGSRFRLGPDGLPVRLPGNTTQARFICNIPRSATPGAPARPSLYGHGLFGDAGEVGADNVEQLGNDHDVLVCASDWVGMAEEDIPNAITVLGDLSRFPTLADRLQQGFLNFLFLGRALVHPGGLAADPAFRRDGKPLIDTRRLFYYGNSQGGIAGGALTAVAPDFTRSVLYVGAMNYSLLLTRSVDFDEFALVLYPSYPDELERPLVLSLVQMLWDRGEPNGYAQHITRDPLPGHAARTRCCSSCPSATIRWPTSPPRSRRARSARACGRRSWTQGAARTAAALRHPAPAAPPTNGGGLVVWDIGPLRPPGCGAAPAPACLGTPAPPTTNTPNRLGVDPHDLVIDSEARVRAPDRPVPAARRAPGRRVRRGAVPRGRLDRPVAAQRGGAQGPAHHHPVGAVSPAGASGRRAASGSAVGQASTSTGSSFPLSATVPRDVATAGRVSAS